MTAIDYMKVKNLAIFFLVFLLLAWVGVSTVKHLTNSEVGLMSLAGNDAPGGLANALNQAKIITKSAEQAAQENERALNQDQAKAPASEPNKKILANLAISGVKYEAQVSPDSTVYDLMRLLKEQNKIDFKSRDYSRLGFFIEEINGVKNDPAGKNWLYYVNGQPAQVGVSYYKLKNNDVIEWKYEKKSF